MPCETLKDSQGRPTAIICRGRGRRPKPCAYCGRPSSRLCDFPVSHRGRGPGIQVDVNATEHRPAVTATCDAPLCDRCTTRISGDRDLCRAHVPLWDVAAQKPKVLEFDVEAGGPGAGSPS